MPDQQRGRQKPSDPIWWIHFLCSAHAACITPFIRTGFGLEGLGLPAVLSGVMLFVCAGAEPCMVFWLIAWFVAIIIQRIITVRELRRGAIIHSRFAGRSLLLKIPFLRKERYIMAIEALLCLFMAALILTVSQFMAGFMAIGCVTILVRYGIDDALRERRIQRMNDARIEADWYRSGMN